MAKVTIQFKHRQIGKLSWNSGCPLITDLNPVTESMAENAVKAKYHFADNIEIIIVNIVEKAVSQCFCKFRFIC